MLKVLAMSYFELWSRWGDCGDLFWRSFVGSIDPEDDSEVDRFFRGFFGNTEALNHRERASISRAHFHYPQFPSPKLPFFGWYISLTIYLFIFFFKYLEKQTKPIEQLLK